MFSKDLEQTIGQCYKRAREARHEFMTVEHLLLALLDNPSAQAVLRACGADFERLRGELEQAIEASVSRLAQDDGRDTQPTLGFQRVLQRAVYHVQSSGKKEVTGANVLVAIFGEKDSHAVYYLNQQDVSRLDVVNYISHGVARLGENTEGGGTPAPGEGEGKAEAGEGEGKGDALAEFATNLNEQARIGKIDPLVGRADEIERTIQVLCRRRKNNPLYVGEAGVGKTAIAEGLAKRIVEGDVPEVLSDAVIYALDLGALVAGTKYRGDFEKRLKGVLASIRKIPGAILFIDEIHTIIGAGSASGGTMDASNLIMPLVRFISPTDPRMLSTLEAINRPPLNGGLVSDGLVHRYDAATGMDGLTGTEGTFNMCSFWLVEALTRAGRTDRRKLDEAQLLFERMLGYANHLGLYAEETGDSGEALGNFPQAFTHLALISAAFDLDRALDGN